MIIKSYLAYPMPGKLSALLEELDAMSGCEIIPATNRELLVLVTESADDQTDKALFTQLEALPTLQTLTLVSGHNEPVSMLQR